MQEDSIIQKTLFAIDNENNEQKEITKIPEDLSWEDLKKESQKLYRRHSGRPGGMKIEKFESLKERIPERIIEQAVKGMLPHNSLGRQQFKKLKVYKGADHPHAAQNPVLLNS